MPGKPETLTAHLPAQGVPRARQKFSESDADRPDVFVGLAISGGGSRAAVFGMAVMKELNQLGILKHVSAISTTSGGGVAGAYYAVHAPEMDWDKAQQAMATDFLGKWVRKNIGPGQLARVLTSDEDRSDLMADVFDAELFHGKTYSHLGAFKPGSAPIWLANATQIGATRRFTFSDLEFTELRSSLGSFPLSQAVVASAAFPGAFNTVTLRSYTPARIQDDRLVYESSIQYRHLIDGGPTDNLGIEALLELARSHDIAKWGVLGAGTRGSRQGTCLLLIVDAYPRGIPSRYDSKDDLRGAFGRLVDLNFLDALDALLVSRRSDLLGYLGLEDSTAFGHRNSTQFVHFDAPNYSSRIGLSKRLESPDRLYAPGSDPTPASVIAEGFRIPDEMFRCAVWHINLSGMRAIQNYIQVEGETHPRPSIRSSELDEQVDLHQALVEQIDTNFRLKGPVGCPATLLDKALRESAAVLVREDWQSQRAACDWLRSNGLEVGEKCGSYEPPSSINRMPLRDVVVPVGIGAIGQADETVSCTR